MPDASLVQQAEGFAAELTALLQRALPGSPAAVAEVAGERVVVRPEAEIPLFVDQRDLAVLTVSLRCQLDSRGKWLAIEESNFGLTARRDRTPVLRFHYVRGDQRPPGGHIHVHAHRGALSHLLSQSGHDEPHDISALHIPVGGARFRPCLEDVIQFLFEECRFDSIPGWKEAVQEGRASWRRRQVKAVVRDFQGDAAEALEALGYRVEPPATGVPEVPEKALHSW